MFGWRISARRTEKLPHSENFSYFFMVLWRGRSCEEMCGAILWVGRQDDSTNLQSIYSMHRRAPLERGRIEIRWRIVTSMHSNCSEMLLLGADWKTWYFMISKQICTIYYKMDQSLWQAPVSIDIFLSSHMWIQTELQCGLHCQTMQAGTVSRLRFCSRSWGLTIHFWRNTIVFGSHTFAPRSWMCKKQTSVSHSSAESEIISLDGGLRLDGIPALD